jgi:hypothetical protein
VVRKTQQKAYAHMTETFFADLILVQQNSIFFSGDQLSQEDVEAHDHLDCCIADDQLPK